MPGRRVLVTGGAGYIGSHACKALAARGDEVLAYDDLSTGHRELVKWGALAEGDIADGARLEEVFAAFKPDAVLHFAALATLGASLANPDLCYRVNVEGTAALLRAMQKHACRHLIFSSSCSVYAPTEGVLSEDSPFGPNTPYGDSKLQSEEMIRAGGIASVCLRYFNAAGADAQGEAGEKHEPETHALPLAIAAAYGRGRFRLFGTDYPTPDGTAIRDYIHVTDLAAAHVQALDYLQQGGENTALNVGTGQGVSVRELVAAVEKVTGRQVPVDLCPRREGDPVRLVADAGRIGRVLGWQARHSSIENLVRTAAAWHRQCWGA